MSSSRPRSTRALSGLALGAVPLLLAACGSSSSSSAAPSSTSTPPAAAPPASTLPKTLVFSPLSLAPPALKGLSSGVTGYGKSKGWETIIQDPNFDPHEAGDRPQRGPRLRPRRRRLGHRGRAEVDGRHAEGGPEQGHPDPGQRQARGVRLHRPAARHHLRLHRLHRRRHRARRPARQVPHREDRRQRPGPLRASRRPARPARRSSRRPRPTRSRPRHPTPRSSRRSIVRTGPRAQTDDRQRPAGPPGPQRGDVRRPTRARSVPSAPSTPPARTCPASSTSAATTRCWRS